MNVTELSGKSFGTTYQEAKAKFLVTGPVSSLTGLKPKKIIRNVGKVLPTIMSQGYLLQEQRGNLLMTNKRGQ